MSRLVSAHSSGRAVVMACALIAAGSTILSLSISAIAGWSRGDTTLNSVLWAALGVLATSVAHLFIAVARLGAWPMKVLTWVLWAGCMAFAVVSHASYFLASQQARAAPREVTGAPQPTFAGRPLSKILADRGKLEEEVARLAAAACAPDCSSIHRRSAAVRARIVVLNQEALELNQSLAALEVTRMAKERARSDPAVWAISGLVHLPAEVLHLGLGLLVGLLLDGVGCISWAILLTGRKTSHSVTQTGSTETQPKPIAGGATRTFATGRDSVDGHDSTTGTTKPRCASPDPTLDPRFEEFMDRARQGLASGAVRNTVRELREHLECSQAAASSVNRALKREA